MVFTAIGVVPAGAAAVVSASLAGFTVNDPGTVIPRPACTGDALYTNSAITIIAALLAAPVYAVLGFSALTVLFAVGILGPARCEEYRKNSETN
jgi:hypothetical protein